MTTSLRVPVTVTEEAAEHIAALGQRAEFEQMLEKVVHFIPELRRIEVSLNPPYDTGDEPGVMIIALRDGQIPDDDPARDRWDDWIISAFHADVWRHYTLTVLPAHLS